MLEDSMALLNNIAHLWWQWMGPMLVQVTLLIAIISILDLLLRNWAWPQVRYGLWILVLVKLLIPPSWSFNGSLVSQLHTPVRQAMTARVTVPANLTPLTTPAPAQTAAMPTPITSHRGLTSLPQPGQVAAAKATASTSAPDIAVKPDLLVWVMLVWLVGILVYMALLFGKMLKLRRWHEQQKEREIPQWFHELLVLSAQRLGLEQLPAVVFANKAVTPAVYGMFRPVLLLPAGYFDNLKSDDAEHVLLHELAHLKRGDLWLHGLTLFLQVVYWMNPLMLWVQKQIKQVREICCDLTVASVLREKTAAYRQTLLETARRLLTEKVEPGLGFLGVFEEPYRLVTRLKWLEKKSWETRTVALITAFAAAFILMFSLLPMAEAEKNGDVIFKMNWDKPSANAQAGKDTKPISLNITFKETEPLYAVVLPMVGSPNDQFEQAAQQVRSLAAQQGIKVIGSPFARYFSDPEKVALSQSNWEIGYRVKPGTQAKAPLEIIQQVGWNMACTQVEGIKNTDRVWEAFIAQIQDMGYIPCFPPAMEFCTGDQVGKEFWWKTELCILAFRPEDGYPGMEITFKTTPEETALVLPMYGSYAQLPQAIAQLESYIKKNQITTTGDQFGCFYSDASETLADNYVWEVGYPVAPGTQAHAPFVIKEYPASPVASAIIKGKAEQEYPWAAFITMSILSGQIPMGPGVEIWSADQTGNPTTEMLIPVMDMQAMAQDISGIVATAALTEESIPTVTKNEQVWHFKEINEEETWSLGKKVDSKFLYTSDTWIGQDVIALVEPNRKMIFNKTENRFYYVNLKDSTWVESAVPLNIPAFVDDELYWRYQKMLKTGKVKKTGKNTDLSGKKCTLYEVNYWNSSESGKTNERDIEVWASDDFPCNLELFYGMMDIMRALHNSDTKLRNELAKVKGIQMQVIVKEKNMINGKHYISNVVEASQTEAPAGLFTVPAGFTQKERLQSNDF